MLRRPPTAIQLTAEDLAMYEDAKAEAAATAQSEAARRKQENTKLDGKPHLNEAPKPASGDHTRSQVGRTREERIGIGR